MFITKKLAKVLVCASLFSFLGTTAWAESSNRCTAPREKIRSILPNGNWDNASHNFIPIDHVHHNLCMNGIFSHYSLTGDTKRANTSKVFSIDITGQKFVFGDSKVTP